MILTISSDDRRSMSRLSSSRSSTRRRLMQSSVSSTCMPTFLQKLKLAFRGWARRREESQRDFLAKNTGWGAATAKTPAAVTAQGSAIDLEGLQVAFLDESGQIVYYLDTESGDVADVRDGRIMPNPRFRRVPRRNET